MPVDRLYCVLDLLDAFYQLVEDRVKIAVAFLFLADFFKGVNDSSMVTAAKELANLWQGRISQGAAQVHGAKKIRMVSRNTAEKTGAIAGADDQVR